MRCRFASHVLYAKAEFTQRNPIFEERKTKETSRKKPQWLFEKQQYESSPS